MTRFVKPKRCPYCDGTIVRFSSTTNERNRADCSQCMRSVSLPVLYETLRNKALRAIYYRTFHNVEAIIEQNTTNTTYYIFDVELARRIRQVHTRLLQQGMAELR